MTKPKAQVPPKPESYIKREREREQQGGDPNMIKKTYCGRCLKETTHLQGVCMLCSFPSYSSLENVFDYQITEFAKQQTKFTEFEEKIKELTRDQVAKAAELREANQKLTTEQKQTKALTLLSTTRKEALEREKQALIQLANKKITNQKEAKALLKELTEKWEKEKEELTGELTNTKTTLTNTLKSLQDLQTENRKLNQTNQNQTQRILALEADKQDLIQQLTNQKQKHQTYQQKEKSLLEKEIKLIKEVLHE